MLRSGFSGVVFGLLGRQPAGFDEKRPQVPSDLHAYSQSVAEYSTEERGSRESSSRASDLTQGKNKVLTMSPVHSLSALATPNSLLFLLHARACPPQDLCTYCVFFLGCFSPKLLASLTSSFLGSLFEWHRFTLST